jgi:hypothetical protein
MADWLRQGVGLYATDRDGRSKGQGHGLAPSGFLTAGKRHRVTCRYGVAWSESHSCHRRTRIGAVPRGVSLFGLFNERKKFSAKLRR